MGKNSKLLMTAILGAAAGFAAGEKTIGKARKKAMDKMEDDNIKFQEFYSLLLQWVHMRNEGRTIGAYLKKCGYHTVAIYGMKELGEELLYELRDGEVEVKYAIDRNADDLYMEIDVRHPDEHLEPVDVVVVTAVHWFEEIEKDMKKRVSCPILSLEDIVYDA